MKAGTFKTGIKANRCECGRYKQYYYALCRECRVGAQSIIVAIVARCCGTVS